MSEEDQQDCKALSTEKKSKNFLGSIYKDNDGSWEKDYSTVK